MKFKQAFALHQQGNLEQAQALYLQVLNTQPNHADALQLLGAIAIQMEQPARAIEWLDKALAIAPRESATHYNRGMALAALRRYSEAIDSYNRAIALNPQYAKAYASRGNAFWELKQHNNAVASYDRAIALQSSLSAIHGLRLHVKTHTCNWKGQSQQLQDLVRKIEQGKNATDPFALLALIDSLSLQRKASMIQIQEKIPLNTELGTIPSHKPSKKIRIGYFSADLHAHATAFLMAELWEHHDKSRFEIIAFSFGVPSNDAMRQRLVRAFDKFIDVRHKTDKEIAQLARDEGIDIAVDLKGFTQDNRFGIFSYRAAPIQVSYIGYPGTVAAEYMDYIVADKTLIPESAQDFYSEKIIYMPHSYQVNDRQREIANKTFTREELGLPSEESGFVFCCFNNNYKITPTTFDGWMRILHQVPNSVLWLLADNPTAAQNLCKEAQQRGIDPQRLVFASRMPLPEHLARHRMADLFIDSLPYNAHTTASDALWAGLPVLTCMGESFASRVAGSLLNAIELPELITTNQAEYEAKAVQLALNPEKLKTIREKLHRNRLTTPLFNSALFTRHLENAYEQIMQRYYTGQAPDHIIVSTAIKVKKNNILRKVLNFFG